MLKRKSQENLLKFYIACLIFKKKSFSLVENIAWKKFYKAGFSKQFFDQKSRIVHKAKVLSTVGIVNTSMCGSKKRHENR